MKATNATNAAIRRIRNTRGSSYLTHGADDYDHRGLNRARREHGKAIIREWECGTEPTPVKPEGTTTFRVVVNTQVYENYGAHAWDGEGECPQYWKAKGGHEYHRAIGDANDVIALGAKGVQAIANKIADRVYRNDEYWSEYATGWNVVPSTEETHDEQMYREMHEEGWMGHQTKEQHAKHMASLILS